MVGAFARRKRATFSPSQGARQPFCFSEGEQVEICDPLSLRNRTVKTFMATRVNVVTVAFQGFRKTPEAAISLQRGVGRKGQ